MQAGSARRKVSHRGQSDSPARMERIVTIHEGSAMPPINPCGKYIRLFADSLNPHLNMGFEEDCRQREKCPEAYINTTANGAFSESRQ
jgi:hypothetical protein